MGSTALITLAQAPEQRELTRAGARHRKEPLRTLVTEVIVTAGEQPRRAEVQIAWEDAVRTG